MTMDLSSRKKNSGFTIYSEEIDNKTGCSKYILDLADLAAFSSRIVNNSKSAKGRDSKITKTKTSSTTSLNTNEYENAIAQHNSSLKDRYMFMDSSKLISVNTMSVSRSLNHKTSSSDLVGESSIKFQTIPVEPKRTYVKNKDVAVLTHIESNKDGVEVERAEKTTYCRPAINMYTYEYVNKTVERNARLTQLVKQLVEIREKEKQTEVWNNYINELKQKHGYYDVRPKNNSTLIPDAKTLQLINNNYGRQTRNRLYLEQITASSSIVTNTEDNEYVPRVRTPSINKCSEYKSNSYCFPTSSQAKKKIESNWCNRPIDRYGWGNRVIVELEKKQPNIRSRAELLRNMKTRKKGPKTFSNLLSGKVIHNNRSTQVISNNLDEDSLDIEFSNFSSYVDETQLKTQQTEKDPHPNCLSNIENKLDILIESINTFMQDIKSKKFLKNTRSTTVSACTISQNRIRDKRLLKREENVFGYPQDKSKTTLHSKSGCKPQGSIDTIWMEEMNKSDKVKRDIEEILNQTDHQCAVKITIDIPTKDSHEEGDFDKDKRSDKVIVEEIESKDDSRRMTIAVNTDPLGILALLRVSTETVKQILSHMPAIDYLSFLAKPLSPHAFTSDQLAVSRYVCNICGMTFNLPSRLNDHIREHNLLNTRECCVCRHALEYQKPKTGLFKCEYCGQVFTRAYCRELHRQNCLKNFNRQEDVRASLMVLT